MQRYVWLICGRKKEEEKKNDVPKIHNSLLFCVPDLTSITYEISCKPTAVLFYTLEHILVGMCLDYDLVGLHQTPVQQSMLTNMHQTTSTLVCTAGNGDERSSQSTLVAPLLLRALALNSNSRLIKICPLYITY